MKSITEQTLIPISLVITGLGGVGWLTTMHANVSANTAVISQIKAEQRDQEKVQNEILRSLARIDERLNRIEHALKIKRP